MSEFEEGTEDTPYFAMAYANYDIECGDDNCRGGWNTDRDPMHFVFECPVCGKFSEVVDID